METSAHTKKLVGMLGRCELDPMGALMSFDDEEEILFELEAAIAKINKWIESNPSSDENTEEHEEKARAIENLRSTAGEVLDLQIVGYEKKYNGSFIQETKDEYAKMIKDAKDRKFRCLGREEENGLIFKDEFEVFYSNSPKR